MLEEKSHVQKLVSSYLFVPTLLASTTAFYWVFELFRAYAFAASYDEMLLLFDTKNLETSQIGWEVFGDLIKPGAITIAGTMGILGTLAITGFCALRYRFFRNSVHNSTISNGVDMEALRLPVGIWMDTGFRIAIGILLVAISVIVAMNDRSRDAFELAQTEIVYPDMHWYSNIEFTIGLIGCFTLASVVFLWSRIQFVAVDNLQTDEQHELDVEIANWEAAIKR